MLKNQYNQRKQILSTSIEQELQFDIMRIVSKDIVPLVFADAASWRAWLSENHDKAREAWVVHFKVKSPQIGLRYQHALEEAIAFGWIDGRLATIDQDRFQLRYTPRKKGSLWSRRNKLIAEQLISAGRMSASGMAAVQEAKSNGNWDVAYSDKEPESLPDDLRQAFADGEIAFRNFQSLPVSARNMYIRWVGRARTPETRESRIKSVVNYSRAKNPTGGLTTGKQGEIAMPAIGAPSTDDLFIGRPAASALFGIVRSYIQSLGPVTVERTKTQISFGVKRKFAWVWLPQMWIKKHPEDSLVLTIGLDRRIDDVKIKEVVQPYPGRWVHHIVLEKETDFDEDIKKWLAEAYRFGQRTRMAGGTR
jgi:uncharacterized protein YdeI (YjbR/CyaY-like superfamily)